MLMFHRLSSIIQKKNEFNVKKEIIEICIIYKFDKNF